ncbi:phytanoyl-CoA dioxygenase family protein [Chitinophaga varians]|uniref:phytanoyl-CoA dioxygenase family protein n=1 Tax=Chitinophaga varians TaxID=2202339 RepID=UPI00165EFA5D|nr:phytanoyl-CoA dioxygenase family protein [Chitinophaga varians]MBC9914775.1 phytanoyl-CoA dioxygenase family protein [Chitinophaga varians]
MIKDIEVHRQQLATQGYTVLEDIFSEDEVQTIVQLIAAADTSQTVFRKTADLFAIRQFLQSVPDVRSAIFSPALQYVIDTLLGEDYVPVKSIYFDKPGQSNWFVAWHQDLTISVRERLPVEGFGPWTVKQNQYAVQPPLSLLENIYTIRLHLDDTDAQNGALKVIPGTHLQGIVRPDTISLQDTPEVSCPVKRGAIMIMRPLLMHASSRSTSGSNRRVVHMEFSDKHLPGGLMWSETI